MKIVRNPHWAHLWFLIGLAVTVFVALHWQGYTCVAFIIVVALAIITSLILE